MSKQVQNFIDDARRFQRCSDHDLAISSLQLAQQEDHHKEHEIEIQKLFSLSYRKIGNYNMALLGYQIHIYISQSELTSIDVLFPQVMIIVIGFASVLDLLHCLHWDIFVPDFLLYFMNQKREKELSEYLDRLFQGQLNEQISNLVDQAVRQSLNGIMDKSMEHVVEESMADVIQKSTDEYFRHEINFIKNYANERTNHVLAQLKLNDSQFSKLRLELIRMRSLPLRNLKDAESKIKEFIRSGYEPFNSFSRNSAVVNLKEIDSAKRTYNNVDYFLNFHDAMYSAEYFADFVRVMHLLICEKIGVDNFDTIRFLYKGIIIKHNKTEPTYTKTSLFLCEKRRFFMARTEKGVVTTI